MIMTLVAGYVALIVTVSPQPANRRVTVPYDPTFVQQIRAGNVVSVSATGSSVTGVLRRSLRYPPTSSTGRSTTRIRTEIPSFADTRALSALLTAHGVTVTAEPKKGAPLGEKLLVALLPMLMVAGLFLLLVRRTAGGGGMGSFGRSRARRVEPASQSVTFSDIAGIDEAKEELVEIVDFLRNPEKYRRLGARIPHGVLLTGPPGTGKTLLARALAGEARVPFFSISASEFVEMFVGVGASRVRDLFAQAKAAAPAIVFIDELDAIGKSRGPAALNGSHEEREQTLNQILTELDGFDPSIGIIVLSATNRPEIIDPALLRPGRFDRRVAVQPPDMAGRRQILKVHTRSVPLRADLDLDRLAAVTPGMVGADLANLVNEAALLAAHRGHDTVTMADALDALEKVLLGTERRIILGATERERSAVHEAGHAVVAMVTPGADPVRKVSIIPRGEALGVTLSAPQQDRFSYDERYLQARLRVLLAGRVAERMTYGDVTSGAESDLRQATELAHRMVGLWGMSDVVGPVAFVPEEERLVAPMATEAPSEETRRLIDNEVRRLLIDAEDAATVVLEEHRERLHALRDALLERESLDDAAAYAAAGLPKEPEQLPPIAGLPEPVST
jgi:cell division protease FtsH